MKLTKTLPCLLVLMAAGCQPQIPEGQPVSSPTIPKNLLSTGVAGTLEAKQTQNIPLLPYTPAQLALLLEPGQDLDGHWTGSSVTDLTQPIEGHPCQYYGRCWGEWPRDLNYYGAELQLLREGEELGEAALIYYQNPQHIETLYQAYESHWGEAAEWQEDQSYNELSMHYFNKYQREPLGDQWLHFVGYSFWDDPSSPNLTPLNERELLRIEIVVFRCHAYLKFDLRFPPQTEHTAEDQEERVLEQEEIFDLVYEYARNVDQRIIPYACRGE